MFKILIDLWVDSWPSDIRGVIGIYYLTQDYYQRDELSLTNIEVSCFDLRFITIHDQQFHQTISRIFDVIIFFYKRLFASNLNATQSCQVQY